jgi:flagellar basal body-associated protein FliL
MRNKKSKNTKNSKDSKEQESHIFEIHTMQGDIKEAKEKQSKALSQKAKKDVSQKRQAVPLTPTPMQQNNVQKPISQNLQSQETNPFLSKESETFVNQNAKVSEKNKVPGDIVFEEEKKEKKIPKKEKAPKKKKSITIVIILIVLILFAAAALGVFMLQANKQEEDAVIIKEEKQLEDIANTIEESLDEDIQESEKKDIQEEVVQTYSVDLPNYFAIDIESETSEDDIIAELSLIASNMIKEDIEGPISFIVTDSNNNPVAFHVFAISAGMNIPQDILSALEEEFEIYAYNDEMLGVRFGFGIDIKDVETFNTAIIVNEDKLPKAFDLILNGLGATANNVVFNDSVYKTHPVRYYNMNESETYSVDYTINDMQFVLGASKMTLRQIIDYLQDLQISENIL